MAAKFDIQEKKPLFGRRQFLIYLVAANGQRVALGERYPTYQHAQRGCQAIKDAAYEAEVPWRR